MSPGFEISLSGAVWARNGKTYVAGAQGNGSNQVASIWSPSPQVTSLPAESPFISSIGGSPEHVYGAGTTFFGNASNAWFARMSFDTLGRASFHNPVILPSVPGFSREYGEGVRTDAAGKPIVVGDVVTDGPPQSVRAVQWSNGSAHFLDSMIGTASWSITGASGINSTGEIAAEGMQGNVEHAILLRPAHLGQAETSPEFAHIWPM